MKRFVAGFLGVLILGAVAHAAPVELTFTSVYIDRHPVVTKVFNPWMEEVKKLTNGEVVIKYFNPGTICPEPDMYSSVVNGTVDIACNTTGRNTGTMWLCDAAELPFLSSSARSASLAICDISHNNPVWAEQFKDVKLLNQFTSGLLMVHTSKKQVKTVDDVKGLKLTTVSTMGRDILKALGANPIMVPTPDVYMTLSRGMADGCFMAIAPLRSFKINETIKFSAVIDASLAAVWMGMSKKAWDRLTPEQQKIMAETGGMKLAEAAGQVLDQGAVDDGKWMQENGHTFTRLTEKEKEPWRAATKSVTEAWVKSAESKKGTTGVQKIVDQLRDLNKKYEAQPK